MERKLSIHRRNQNSMRQYNICTILVGAGLCSARLDAAVLQKSSANSHAPAYSFVGADAHIGPLGSCKFAEEYRKNGAFCRADATPAG